MPVTYTEKLWRSLYAVQDGEEWITYGRRWWELGGRIRYERRAKLLAEMGVSGRVLVVGAGFGYLPEALKAEAPDVVWADGLDASPYVRAHADTESPAGCRPFFGDVTQPPPIEIDNYDWVIDEDCLPGYAPEDAPAFLDACEWRLRHGLPPERVVHIVTTLRGKPGDSALTWLSADEWRAMRPSHTWLPDA